VILKIVFVYWDWESWYSSMKRPFHRCQARGIEVEVFFPSVGDCVSSPSPGEGPNTVYPFSRGGYCKLKGEDAVKKAWETASGIVAGDKGSFFGPPPWRRILVAVSGSAANFCFAIVAFSLVWIIGFTYSTSATDRPRIRLSFPSRYHRVSRDQGGPPHRRLHHRIDGKPVATYRDLQEIVAKNPEKTLDLHYRRGRAYIPRRSTRPSNKETGAEE
jgi:membrane-associated protease RseP (regulator of RpoE activity)